MSSTVKKSSAPRGTTIVQSHGRDDSGHAKGGMDKPMGGSTTNLSHSLSGASAVQTTKK